MPLYALIQTRSAPERLSCTIAFNNVMNAILMVLSAAFALILLALGTSIAGIFLAMAVLNALVALQGLWGSLFSPRGGRAFFTLPRRLFARVGLVCGEVMAAADMTPDVLRDRVLALRGDRL